MSHALRLLPLFLVCTLQAEEPKEKEKTPADQTVEELAEKLRPSIAVITIKGREGRRESIGTGFVIDKGGLIATNLHVIGEGRPITVELDKKTYEAKEVHATDRTRDLAIIRIEAKDLKPLPLGNSDKLKEGQTVVALGNPQGLKHSVVSGVLSGKREIEGQSMLQLAMPVEPGNSGGPVVDLQGNVHGILTLKSAVTENLGFAVSINQLKPLIEKPNPIPIENWLTMGALDPEEWKSFMGARWRQRAGRILVEGTGTGFGGRSICISQRKVEELPYEVRVMVKLNDEKGAAGLIVHHAGDKHYGFYPTGGKIRFTRFDGPDVFTWKILEEFDTPHYHPGEWNSLKLRLTKEGIKGYVNDQLVLDSKDTELTSGQAGLAKFRDTQAEFKQFQIGKEIVSAKTSPEVRKDIWKSLELLKPSDSPSKETMAKILKEKGSNQILRDKARELEQQAAKFRELANQLHQQRTLDELSKLLAKPEAEIDLIHAALLISKLDNEELEVEVYREEVERMAKKMQGLLPKEATDEKKIELLNKFLFEQRGFHGSRSDYYNRSNTYLNEVIDDREGLPITLSVIYIEVAKRIGLNISGIGLPGHFIVRHFPKEGEGDFIDAFDRGKIRPLEEVKQKAIEATGGEMKNRFLEPLKKKAIITRMVRNLLRVAQEDQDLDAGLRYLDVILALEPESSTDRFMRAAVRYSRSLMKEAKEDVDYLIDHPSEEVDMRRVKDLKRLLEK